MKKIFLGIMIVNTMAFGSGLDSYNNGMEKFNKKVDKYITTPVGKGYRAVMPDAGEKGVSNFFDNIGEVKNVVNNGAQGEGKKSLTNVKRFAINSTVGVFGLFDVATKMGIEEENASFDGTLEKYGVGEGAYVVVPVLGGMTTRQMAGMVGDSVADPINHTDYKTENTIGKVVDGKARQLRSEEEKLGKNTEEENKEDNREEESI